MISKEARVCPYCTQVVSDRREAANPRGDRLRPPTIDAGNKEQQPLAPPLNVQAGTKAVNAFCHACGMALEREDRFCPKCGAPARSHGRQLPVGGDLEDETYTEGADSIEPEESVEKLPKTKMELALSS